MKEKKSKPLTYKAGCTHWYGEMGAKKIIYRYSYSYTKEDRKQVHLIKRDGAIKK
jgi:hypothetical protein